MKLMQYRLENIIKNKLMKQYNNLPVQQFKTVEWKNSVPGSVTKFLT